MQRPVAYPAALVSNGSATRRPNGAGSSTHSASIQNTAQVQDPNYGGPKAGIAGAVRSNNFALKAVGIAGAVRSNFALKARLLGTEFLDAETGRQKSSRK
jgi:hypothetical protein